MNLFYLIPYTPTVIRTRPYHIIRVMASRGHRVTLATLYESDAERAWLRRIEDMGVCVLAQPLKPARKALNLAGAFFTRLPLQSRFCLEPALLAQVKQVLGDPAARFDAVHVEHLRGAEYGVAVRRAMDAGLLPAAPVVWDSVDCISLLFEKAIHTSRSLFGRWATRFDLPRTRAYEGFLVNFFEQTLVTSRVDAEGLMNLAQARDRAARASIEIVPNGVDLDAFCPPEGEREADTLVFSGKMSYHANVSAVMWLANEIMPLVWEQRPQAKLRVVGSAPGPEIKALETRCAGRVEVTGYVDRLPPYLQSAAVAVAPMTYGAGIQNKVLEAFACGAPVVATPQAVSAIGAANEKQLLLASDGPAFAGAILRLLDDPALRARIGRAGRAYVEQHNSWSAVGEQLERVYERCKIARSR